MIAKQDLYLGQGGPIVEIVVSWSPPVGVRSRVDVLFLELFIFVSCYQWVCLILWVNFVYVGCWLLSNMILCLMEFGHKLHRSFHLLGGENVAANMQHLHQSWWARESKSLDNHLLLLFHLVMLEGKTSSLIFYLQLLGIGINILSCVCCLVSLMLIGILMPMYCSGGNGTLYGCIVLKHLYLLCSQWSLSVCILVS